MSSLASKSLVHQPALDSRGLVFFLSGAMVSPSEYTSLAQVLVEARYTVVVVPMNVLWYSHAQLAQNVIDLYKSHYASQFSKVNIVGHSVGGKVSLLLMQSTLPINQVLALDPVDDNPPEFTNASGNNKSLKRTRAASLVITWSAGTLPSCIAPIHNASSIHAAIDDCPVLKPLITYQDAGHMAYCDHEGGIWKWMMKGGTPQGNAHAMQATKDLLRSTFK
jgi:Alpha/beta hydrolase family